jgi:peptidoglycan hydrolase-like protein with peptidoglycan-binding domain
VYQRECASRRRRARSFNTFLNHEWEANMGVLKMGSNGDEVKKVQTTLKKLGFDVAPDGIFGQKTHNAIITMQTIFGYDADAMVGPATSELLEKQAGYGWNVETARKAFNKPAG